MKLFVLAVSAALILFVVLLLVRSRRTGEATTPNVASYQEIKRLIRSGEIAAPDISPLPKSAPPLPLEEILGLEDSDELVIALHHYVSAKVDKHGERSLTPTESAAFHVLGLEAQVNNGGFDQYFFNSDGDNASEALAGLELVGATKTAQILRAAMATFGPEGPDPQREIRWQQMDRWDESAKSKLESLDNQFFEYVEPISDLIAAHCRAHVSEL